MRAPESCATKPAPSPRAFGWLAHILVGFAALGCGHGDGTTLPRADEVYVEGPIAGDAGAGASASVAASNPNPVAAFYRSSAMVAVGAPAPDGVASVDEDADASDDPTDLEITRLVRAAIAGDAFLSDRALGVHVATREGTVILRGRATSDGERARIAQHARAVPGVRDVVNVIAVDR